MNVDIDIEIRLKKVEAAYGSRPNRPTGLINSSFPAIHLGHMTRMNTCPVRTGPLNASNTSALSW